MPLYKRFLYKTLINVSFKKILWTLFIGKLYFYGRPISRDHVSRFRASKLKAFYAQHTFDDTGQVPQAFGTTRHKATFDVFYWLSIDSYQWQMEKVLAALQSLLKNIPPNKSLGYVQEVQSNVWWIGGALNEFLRLILVCLRHLYFQ